MGIGGERLSTKRARITRWVALLWMSLLPGAVYGQNCALCYTQAAGAGSRMIAALRSGILALVVPPMLICVGITWMAYKKRNQFNEYPADEAAHTKRDDS